MATGAFGACKDLHATWTKGFDANNCPIVTFSSNKEGLEDCDVAVGPYLKTVTVNGNEMNVSALLADINFEYVPYDREAHVLGPLLGTGTPSDPFQVPVKECNFVFVDYDPDEHVEGQPVEGDGTAVSPWQIPVKQCNFEYVPYEPATHDEGVIEGDGTPENPWQIPFKECNFNYVPYDPSTHDFEDPIEGDGTAENPWQIPVKECNFQYVAYDPAVHSLGNIVGEGTIANPWQIPLFELDTDMKICAVRIVNNPEGGENIYSFEYDVCDKDDNVVDTLVATDVPVPTFVDKTGAALTGEIELLVPSDFGDRGNNYYAAAGLQGINTAGECELFSPPTWAYVPYDPDTHSDELQGAGTEAAPFEIPIVRPTKESIVSDFIAGDKLEAGSANFLADDCNKYNICDLIPAHLIYSCTIVGETISGEMVEPTNPEKSIVQSSLWDFQWGKAYAVAGGPALINADNPFTIQIPAHDPDCLIAVHISAGITGFNAGDQINGAQITDFGSMAGLREVCRQDHIGVPDDGASTGIEQVVWFLEPTDGSATTVEVTYDIFEVENTTNSGAVLAHVTMLCDANGNSCEYADFLFSEAQETSTSAPSGDGSFEDVSGDLTFGDCDAIYFGAARHAAPVVYDGQVGLADGAWFVYNGPSGTNTEAYQFVSVATTGCQNGTTSGVIEGGNGAWNYTHIANTDTQGGSESKLCFIPTACEPILPTNTSADTETCVQTVKNINCLKDAVVECCITGSVEMTAEYGDVIRVVPLINGELCSAQSFGLDNSVSSSELGESIKTVHSFNIKKRDDTILSADCGETSITAGFRVFIETTRDTTGSQVTLGDWTVDCEVNHV